MSRPKYKELYLKEKAKTKFSYNLLMSINKMLNEVGIESEVSKRRRPDMFSLEVLLKIYNPSNNLYGMIGINEDFLEGASLQEKSDLDVLQ